MKERDDFGPVTEMNIVCVTQDNFFRFQDTIATEIPLTIAANDVELATLLASPSDLRELTLGYLYTSGYISTPEELEEYVCDRQRWTVNVHLSRMPDPSLMQKRLYTSGCGRCAMYTTVNEISLRKQLENSISVAKATIFEIASQLRKGTSMFIQTGSMHCSLLIEMDTGREILIDDVARHNSLDKVIGRAMTEKINFSRCILARTGRTSSEIIYKIRRCGIPITIALGAPTHQAVHLAREMGITVIGFAREDSFNLYSSDERVRM